MAIVTTVCRSNMCGAFTPRQLAIVTCRAVRVRCRMVEANLRPCGGDVAILAHIISRDVILRFAGGRASVMACDTRARHIGMVEADLQPGGRDVAILAHIIRRDVVL